MRFNNRLEARRLQAGKLTQYAGRSDVVVLALPRGGVPVAFEVAQGLAAPLDLFLVRKLGVPDRPEVAMGAIAEGPRGGKRGRWRVLTTGSDDLSGSSAAYANSPAASSCCDETSQPEGVARRQRARART
jgi:predicted phosphoribosyltransferase